MVRLFGQNYHLTLDEHYFGENFQDKVSSLQVSFLPVPRVLLLLPEYERIQEANLYNNMDQLKLRLHIKVCTFKNK